MVGSGFFSTAQKIDLLNGLYPELYDLLVTATENYYTSTSTFTISSASQAYDLPDDFYKIVSIDFNVGGLWTNVYPFQEGERNAAFNSTNLPAGPVRLRYVPAPPVFSVDALDDEIDGVSGWDELVVLHLAIAMLQTEESPTSGLERRLTKIEERITKASQNRDLSMPGRVTDVLEVSPWSVRNTVRYRLYGSQIEFISVEWVGGYSV